MSCKRLLQNPLSDENYRQAVDQLDGHRRVWEKEMVQVCDVKRAHSLKLNLGEKFAWFLVCVGVSEVGGSADHVAS